MQSAPVKLARLKKGGTTMSNSESDVTFSVKVVLFGAAILGFIFPAVGLGFWPSIIIVAILAYTYVALARAKEAKAKRSNLDQ
jgi:hypothetical protein